MKRTFIVVLMIGCFLNLATAQNGKTCDPSKEKAGSSCCAKPGLGVAMSKDGATEAKLLPAKMKTEKELFVKIKGEVVAACQVKGCWMTADLGNGQTMRIRFKDYAFFVPKDSGGKQFYAQGIASWDETSVAELQHYAEDAGKSKAEIAKIKEPKKELTFLAEGVILESK